ncbi:UNVERIFIED_CONTAM: hypothetical protein Scaly_2718600 [Sesamum calycinum]|uniref:MULE transposase domain-containing protein n=1 Tax=Sesamum calycinum TaxID=2727403 RepID=A0AAW2J351_9LAMI
MYDVEIEGVEVSETGAVDGGQTEGVGVSETGAVGVWVAETEGAGVGETEGVGVSETEAAGVGGTEGVGVSETEAAGFGETEGVGVSDGVVVSETDSDDSSEGDEEYVGDGQSGSSSDSDCPSWMLEDLEGPLDDDIFVSRDAEYGGEDDLHSLKGSDDENVDHVVWNDAMDRQDVDLCIVMKTTTFQIKSIKGQHNCAHRIENKQANYKYIGKRIQDFVKDNPSEGLKSLKNKIRRDIQVDVSLFKVYRAKKYALELMKGDVKQQYARLYDYCATVCKHNSCSSMILKVDRCLNPPVLQRMYVCFGGLKEGFLDGCRPFIGLDGCFLKGMHKGQLLSAIGRDGNDNIYPIAMAYVEIEKYDSWEWFLNLLLRDIGSHDERGWAFISDRQKGLIEAVTQLAPRAEHRFCLSICIITSKANSRGKSLKIYSGKLQSSRHAQTSDGATPSSQEDAAEMHTQSSSSVPHCNATEESFPYAESSSSVPLSNATAELHTNVLLLVESSKCASTKVQAGSKGPSMYHFKDPNRFQQKHQGNNMLQSLCQVDWRREKEQNHPHKLPLKGNVAHQLGVLSLQSLKV